MTDFSPRVSELQDELTALHAPINSRDVVGIYDMQKAGEKARLAQDIWTIDFQSTMEHLRTENPELIAVLRDQISNTTPVTEISMVHKERQLDGILLNIVRAQSIHKVPALTVALSLACEANLVHAAERTLSARMAGPFARLPSSRATILAAKDIYSSLSTRTCRSPACEAVVQSTAFANA